MLMVYLVRERESERERVRQRKRGRVVGIWRQNDEELGGKMSGQS
jgi:hypothetical protein